MGTVASYDTRFGIVLDDASKAKSYELISNEVLPRHLESVEKLFKASSTGWIAGTEEPSPADFVWYCRLANFIPEHAVLSEKIRTLENYPECRAFVEKFNSLDAIKEYNR